jgi:hypothetical protein
MGSEKSENQQSQLERFKETARQLGCDEDGAAFDEKLTRIAKHKPKPDFDTIPARKPK